MEDRIPGWLQHHYKTCCEKGSCHGRWACMITLQRCNFWMGGLAYDSHTYIINLLQGYKVLYCSYCIGAWDYIVIFKDSLHKLGRLS